MGRDEQAAFAAELERVRPAVVPLLGFAGRAEVTHGWMAELIDAGRAGRDDRLLGHVACLLAAVAAEPYVRERPSGRVYGLRIRDAVTGDVVDDPDRRYAEKGLVPCGLALARMIAAVCNADVLAARDVYTAFATTHHEYVTCLLADLALAAAHPGQALGHPKENR